MEHPTPAPAAFGVEPYVTKRQLARHFGFSTRWVELRVTDGMPRHVFGGRVRYRLSEVEAWLRERPER